MTRACVVVPIYKPRLTDLELVSWRQILKVLSGHDIYVVSPRGLRTHQAADPTLSGVRRVYLADWYFKSIKRYNRLLMAERFYRRFTGYESILLAQLDSFVFRDELNDWSKKSFGTIGAPWFKGWSNPEPDRTIMGVGNGGFCLRNVDQCLRVLGGVARFRTLRALLSSEKTVWQNAGDFFRHYLVYNYNVEPFLPRLNEDIFWSTVVPARFPDFRLPSIDEAIAFSFEVSPEQLYRRNGNRLPFGCHGWWKYDPDFWKPFIEREGHVV